MSLFALAIPWAACGLVLMLVYRLVRDYVVSSSLEDVPGPTPRSLIYGNLPELQNRGAWPFLDHLTNDYDRVVRMRGMFGKRILWVADPKALHHIVVKDQDIYEEAPSAITGRKLGMGPGLLSTLGDHHRRQRKLLNPVFSIAHLRRVTPVFYEVMNRLSKGIEKQLDTTSNNEVDLLAWMGRAALELIGQGGFGHSFDPLVEQTPNPYADAVKSLVPAITGLIFYRMVIHLVDPLVEACAAHPALGAFIKRWFWLVPNARMQHVKTIFDVLHDTSTAIYTEKKIALDSDDPELKMRVLEGRDLMSVMLRENMNADAADRLPEREIIAQITTFIFAGTDTTSNALARILHLLCLHPDVQEKLRAEIIEARAQNGGGDLDYDALVALPYLEAVCRETLRLYAPVPFVSRQARRDALLPLSAPLTLRDGSRVSALHVPQGTSVLVAIHSVNRSAALWGADAHVWRPERWLEKLPDAVAEARVPGVYSNLMTFIGGGRACIGFKFSQLEMKVVLATLLSSFRFSLCDGKNADIVWNRAGIAYPTVGNDGGHPSLPLRVERLKC